MSKYFLSCDWGTTSFRLRLVDLQDRRIAAGSVSDEGIARVHAAWQQEKGAVERLPFYRAVLQKHIAVVAARANRALNNVPVVISGMASSALGMVELPYKAVPFHAAGTDLQYEKINAAAGFPHDMIVISGACTDRDVMRGEETQVAGYIAQQGEADRLIIIPGTHSKHISVEAGLVRAFKTYMTGELFELLCSKSILANSVKEGGADSSPGSGLQSFERGVLEAREGNILHSLFSVRTNTLFNTLNPEENYHYLSGLLIGAELQLLDGYAAVTVLGSERQTGLYRQALKMLYNSLDVVTAPAEEATVAGQQRVLEAALQGP